MAAKEAIKELSYDETAYGGCCSREVRKIAIQALEKQIPKKPIDKSRNPTDWHIMTCPICEKVFWNSGQFIRYQPVFCNGCGQAIDWGEEE